MKMCEKHSCEKIEITWVSAGKSRRQFVCKECRKEYKSSYYQNNKEIILNKKSDYYQENKESLDSKHLEYYQKNKDNIKKYKHDWFQDNKVAYNATIRKKYKNDVSFRLRDIFSKSIRQKLKKAGSSKNNNSFLPFLSYTIQELKVHLEHQFEPWMTWENYGKYNSKTWNNNDSSTWKWNIDHIIPQYKLPYISMEDDNFKKCWALENLRPYSAKQNLIDGLTKIRHT